jgi:hypothetical protein
VSNSVIEPASHFRAVATSLRFNTQQEQPDHPRSHTSPGVQDSPPPAAVALEGTIATSAKAGAELTLHDKMVRRIAELETAIAQLPV